MSIILPLAYFLSISLTLSIFLKKKFSDVAIFSFLIPVFLIYATGLLGNTKYGFYLSILLCFIWIIPIIKNIKNWNTYVKEVINQYFDVGLAIFVFLFIGISIFLRYSSFFQWDDFTHWGPMVKEMYRLNKLYCVEESLLPVHKDYPPMVSILELLWCYLSSGFEERFVHRAIAIFSVSLVIPLISLRKEDNNFQKLFKLFFIVVIFISSFFVDFMASQGYGQLSNLITIYPDALVGLFSSFVFFYIYKIKEFNINNCLKVSMLLAFLLMIKQISFAFYLVILLFALFKMYKTNLKVKNKIIKYVLCFIVIPLAVFASWKIYSSSYYAGGQFSLNEISISSLFDIIFFNKGYDYQITTKYNFIDALLNRPMLRLFKITYLEFSFIMLILIFIMLKFILKETKYNIFTILFSILVGIIGFAFTMFVLYLFSFGSYESVNLASFERYMQTSLVFVMYVALFIFITGVIENDNLAHITISCIIVLIVLVANFKENKKFITIKNGYDGITTQYEYVELINQIDTFISPDDDVLIISQTSDYFLEIILKYLYLDYNFDYVSVGKADDIYPYKLDLTFEEWQDYYNDYNYIYTYNTDEAFYYDYWVNLQEEYLLNNRFYTVDENNYLRLVPWTSSEQ